MIGTIEYHLNFKSEHVPSRNIEVWLPPSYHESASNRTYPVLYMHDGQNVFDGSTAYGGIDWGVVPAMDNLLAKAAVPETIIVAIWNQTARWAEYLPQQPFDSPRGASTLAKLAASFNGDPSRALSNGIQSDAYLRFVVTECKPFIDTRYRTQADRESTTIMGSSMGGLISLYALCRYPEVFSGCGCLSTHWPAVEGVMLDYLRRSLPRPGQHRIYFDFGTEALDALYEPLQLQVDQLMQHVGYTAEKDWITRKFEGANHSEQAWRERVHIPLTFLLS